MSSALYSRRGGRAHFDRPGNLLNSSDRNDEGIKQYAREGRALLHSEDEDDEDRKNALDPGDNDDGNVDAQVQIQIDVRASILSQ